MNNIILHTKAVNQLKKQAKLLKQKEGLSHTAALDRVAQIIKGANFKNWHQVTLANQPIIPAETALKTGAILAFDVKDGLDISSDEKLIDDECLATLCQPVLYHDYCNAVDEFDPEGRPHKETLTPEELEEYFHDERDFMYFRLSEMAFKQNPTIRQIINFARRYSFWPPQYLFIKGQLVNVSELPATDENGTAKGVKLNGSFE